MRETETERERETETQRDRETERQRDRMISQSVTTSSKVLQEKH